MTKNPRPAPDTVRIRMEQQDEPVFLSTTPAPEQPEPPAAAPVRDGTSNETVTVVYRGHADGATYGGIRFKPGVPVEVPKDIAEGVLTTPHEAFVVVPAPDEE